MWASAKDYFERLFRKKLTLSCLVQAHDLYVDSVRRPIAGVVAILSSHIHQSLRSDQKPMCHKKLVRVYVPKVLLTTAIQYACCCALSCHRLCTLLLLPARKSHDGRCTELTSQLICRIHVGCVKAQLRTKNGEWRFGCKGRVICGSDCVMIFAIIACK